MIATPQVFYNLGDLDDALTYALGAGKLFDVNETSEYVQTILGAAGGFRRVVREGLQRAMEWCPLEEGPECGGLGCWSDSVGGGRGRYAGRAEPAGEACPPNGGVASCGPRSFVLPGH